MGPDAFDYSLPPERIAQAPAPRRRDARMLVLDEGLRDATIAQLPALLPADALVVVNSSRVVPARIFGKRDDGRRFELLLCAPTSGDPAVRAWVRSARKLRPGDVLAAPGLLLRYVGAEPKDTRTRLFEVVQGEPLTACQHAGELPLPPYIERPDGPHPDDAERYQTVYARDDGSVAAPTAGLHFDRAILEQIDWVDITLHVGPGTFLPMEVEDVADHRVGAEAFEVRPDAASRIEDARAHGRPIVAVGTTVVRVLETIGAPVQPKRGSTELVITPGHEFAVVTHLLTNFHLPRSSLLMLVCSFAGRERVLDAYSAAIDRGYRFYSYGDCMLVSR